MSKKIHYFTLLVLLISLVPYSAFADLDYKLAAPLPGGPDTVPGGGFIAYAKFLFPFLLSFAAVLALLQFVWGGITYMMSDSITSKDDSRDRMWKAVLGLLLALVSVLILRTINPKLIELSLDLPPVGEGVGNLGGEGAGNVGSGVGLGDRCDSTRPCASGGVCIDLSVFTSDFCAPANLGPGEQCIDGPQCTSGVCEHPLLRVPYCK